MRNQTTLPSIKYLLYLGLINSISYLLCLFSFGFTPIGYLTCVFSSVLLFSASVDAHSMYIPDFVLYALLILSVASFFLRWEPSVFHRIAGCVFGGGFLFLLRKLSHNGIGLGDVKLFAVTGLFLGLSRTIFAVFLGYYLAGIWCVFLLIRKKANRKTAIPMVPFFYVSIMTSILWNENPFLK